MPILRLPVRGVAGVDAGEGDETASIVRPALENGERVQVEILAENDFLAGSVFRADGFGEGAGERAELRSILSLSRKPSGAFTFIRPVMRSAICSRLSTPRARAMRRSLPN